MTTYNERVAAYEHVCSGKPYNNSGLLTVLNGRVRCNYCGSYVYKSDVNCCNCGAPVDIKKPAKEFPDSKLGEKQKISMAALASALLLYPYFLMGRR